MSYLFHRNLARGVKTTPMLCRSPPHYHSHGRAPSIRGLHHGSPLRIPSFRAAPGVLAVAAVALGLSTGYYIASKDGDDDRTLTTTTFDGKHAEYHLRAKGKVFDIIVPSQQNPISTHAVLQPEETEAFLRANEKSIRVPNRLGNPVVRWDTNIVSANPVCEDRIAVDLLRKSDVDDLIRSAAPFLPKWREVRTRALSVVPQWSKATPEVTAGAGDGDVTFFSVFDGHGRTATVDLVSRVLHPTIARILGRSALHQKTDSSLIETIQKTYLALDDDIHQSSMNVVTTSPHTLDTDTSLLPHPRPSEHIHGATEYIGSTALTTVVDSESDTLHVINVGDCRAVAGWYNPMTRKWRAQVLNREHSPHDPAEAARLDTEHPGEEGRVIFSRGNHPPKLMGFADMTRVFGDSNLKRSAADSKLVEDSLDTRTGRPIKPYLTPPYKTALPDVLSTPLNSHNGEAIKFIVLGTDGLWARMTPEEACLLTAAHFSPDGLPVGERICKPGLTGLVPFDPPHEPRPWPPADLPCTSPENSKGVWLFKDDGNAATHLVRNCLARGDEELTQLSLSA